MRELGFDVSEAANGREGLEELRAHGRPDVVLVDWNMPEVNGLEFVEAVRADEQYQTLPMMMVTTETEIDQMATALAAGANEYVMKPFTRDIIADKLQLLNLL